MRNAVYLTSDEEFVDAFNNASTWAQVLRNLGLAKSGSAYTAMKRRVESLGLDPLSIKGKAWAAGTKRPNQGFPATPLSEILVEESPWKGNAAGVKRKLLAAGMMVDECVECGLGSEWNGKPITLHLDHENGCSRDYRIENLRILCPNCHSQTPTYGNKKRIHGDVA
jgi:Zn finger protein HypA/HybF involved in hydrogenase expression